jgi:GNAT superfamily N-acetyltransferase
VPRDDRYTVRPYTPDDRDALWELERRWLAEIGLAFADDPVPEDPMEVPLGDHQWDLYYIDRAYLSGRGGFWLAWLGDSPAGQVGAQDIGTGVELQRMFVLPDHRRRGVGSMLAQALTERCAAQGVGAIELWTARHGVGRPLYESLGFREVPALSPDFADVVTITRYTPSGDQIRMRLDL